MRLLWFGLFVLFFFPRGVLGEILNLIESVSGGFLPTILWFGSLVVLDVVCGYVLLSFIVLGKNRCLMLG